MQYSWWDIVLFFGLIYLAVMSLVRLMDAHKRQVLAELEGDVRQAKISRLQANMRKMREAKAAAKQKPA